MPRKKRTADELREASNHLHYEVGMLSSLANGIASEITEQVPIKNALIESLVIHIRNIMDFLYADKPRPDDVIAEDFFDDPEQWKKLRPELSQTLSKAKYRAGKEVAHLTYGRLDVTPEKKLWEFGQIINEISAAMKLFVQNVPNDNLSPQLKMDKA